MSIKLDEILSSTSRMLFIGVGNVLKSDDGVGVYICRNIIEQPGVLALTVEVSIENYIGKINSLQPEKIMILDCMELGAPPGSCRIMTLDYVGDFTFNTHNISLGRLGDFFPYPSFVMGIQPASLAFGDQLSSPVTKTAERIICQINQNSKSWPTTTTAPYAKAT